MPSHTDQEMPAYSHQREEENRQLADQITRLAGHINAANYRFLKLVAEFDREGGWAGEGYYLEFTEWATASQLEKLVPDKAGQALRKHQWAKRLQEKSREQIQNEDRQACYYVASATLTG